MSTVTAADGPAGASDMPAPDERPGYLVVRVDAGGAYLGALMVTDHTGLPLDFRYTDPVTPTRLQRALYGGVLDRYLRCEVVTRTLLAAVEHAPTILLVDDRLLLDEPGTPCPAALIGASAAGPIGDPGATHTPGGDSRLLQVAQGAPPVRVTLPDDVAPDRERDVLAALTRLGATMDLLEPVDRVSDALDLIAAGEAEAEGT